MRTPQQIAGAYHEGQTTVAWKGFVPRRVTIISIHKGRRHAKVREEDGRETSIAMRLLSLDPGPVSP